MCLSCHSQLAMASWNFFIFPTWLLKLHLHFELFQVNFCFLGNRGKTGVEKADMIEETKRLRGSSKQIIYHGRINRKAYMMERIWMTRQLISPNWFRLSVFELPVRRSSVLRQTVISYNLKCLLISQINIKSLSTLDYLHCNAICFGSAHRGRFSFFFFI